MTVDEVTLDKTQHREFERQWAEISRGTVDLLPEQEFREKIKRSIATGTPLRVKQGFDPTSPDIHIGHTVGLRKLKQFQDLGHQIVLIVGDYTAMVGDPSERSSTRPMLTYEEIWRNAETYQDQFFRVLDRERTEVRANSEWFKEMGFQEIIQLASKITVARLLERDDFSKRMKAQTPISMHELFYPLMQAYDSVAITADIEIGATEQTFNLLAGRTIQEAYGVAPQVILTLPILVGLDGVKKMSKSLGNYIGIEESPREIFGKAMSIPDNLIYSYFELATDITLEELREIGKSLEDPGVNPMEIKKKLAERLVDMYHAEGDGAAARAEFERIFSKGQLPDHMPEMTANEVRKLDLDPSKIYLVHLMTRAGMSKSNGEARKLIGGGGVTLNGEKVTDADFEFSLAGEQILKVGKRRFLKLIGD
ncbi:tyrosine--tRNA ligase [candidate division GN15 bacterium]|nr:tyrosine--tRNA ligase [candidate division GN15 bacterium]